MSIYSGERLPLPYKSTANSTEVPLSGTATFTGNWEYTVLPSVMVNVKTDNPGTLYFDFSPDGTNADSTFPPNGFRVKDGVNEFHRALKGPRYFRVRFINDAGDQTYLRLNIYFGDFEQGNAPISEPLAADADAVAIRGTSEDEIMKGLVKGQYILSKFGENQDVDGAEDIWDGGGNYTGFPNTTAEQFQVVSSSINDTSGGSGAQQVRIYYYDSDYNAFDSSGNFLYTDVTLNGTTPVNTGVTGMRIWRAKVILSGSSQSNEGVVSVRWATTTSVVFTAIPVGYSQSQITAFTIPANCTGYMKRFSASLLDTQANKAEIHIRARDFGTNTFRTIRPFTISTDNDIQRRLYGGEQFDAKTDFVFRCTSVSSTNAEITVSYALLLVRDFSAS